MIDLYGGSANIFFVDKNNVSRSVSQILFGVGNVGKQQFPNLVESIRVKTSIASFTEVEVVFAPPFEQAVRLIQSGLLGLGFQTGKKGTFSEDVNSTAASAKSFGFNQIAVQLFYGGKKTPLYKAILMAPELDINPSSITIMTKGISLLFQSTKESDKKVIEDKTRKSIIESFAESLKDKVEIKFQDGDSKCADAMSKIESLNQTETNWRSIKEILQKTNCEILDTGTKSPSGKPTFVIMSKDFSRKIKKNIVTLRLRGQINPNKNIYPILDMKTTVNNYLLGQTLGVQSTPFDPMDKKLKDPTKEQIGLDTKKKFTDSIPSSDGSMSGGASDPEMKKRAPIMSISNSLKENLEGLLQEFTDSPFQYTVKTIGIMDLLPGRPINVEIAGAKLLSGIYDLYSVEHTFSSSGVETSLTLARTGGLGSIFAAGIEKSKAVASATIEGVTKISTTI